MAKEETDLVAMAIISLSLSRFTLLFHVGFNVCINGSMLSCRGAVLLIFDCGDNMKENCHEKTTSHISCHREKQNKSVHDWES